MPPSVGPWTLGSLRQWAETHFAEEFSALPSSNELIFTTLEDVVFEGDIEEPTNEALLVGNIVINSREREIYAFVHGTQHNLIGFLAIWNDSLYQSLDLGTVCAYGLFEEYGTFEPVIQSAKTRAAKNLRLRALITYFFLAKGSIPSIGRFRGFEDAFAVSCARIESDVDEYRPGQELKAFKPRKCPIRKNKRMSQASIIAESSEEESDATSTYSSDESVHESTQSGQSRKRRRLNDKDLHTEKPKQGPANEHPHHNTRLQTDREELSRELATQKDLVYNLQQQILTLQRDCDEKDQKCLDLEERVKEAKKETVKAKQRKDRAKDEAEAATRDEFNLHKRAKAAEKKLAKLRSKEPTVVVKSEEDDTM
ncbi:hypothetical protein K491DRAFT_737408 [Lophiostoma macrostomum CBS 122681]|uniref:Uncharacterized protein n=1 Tax=Lophiostoma macrostomum CBS 122681 TaxID=1314788 RepID=A0A6A6TGH7_9PLEO|nr:hypothetical protein K491DRAFT_737408 [Lophiostoma macrostomum CBS 122681]